MTYEQILEWIEEHLADEIEDMIEEGYSREEIIDLIMQEYNLPSIFSVFLEDYIPEIEIEEKPEKGIGEKIVEGIKSIGQKVISFFKGLFK